MVLIFPLGALGAMLIAPVFYVLGGTNDRNLVLLALPGFGALAWSLWDAAGALAEKSLANLGEPMAAWAAGVIAAYIALIVIRMRPRWQIRVIATSYVVIASIALTSGLLTPWIPE